MFLYTTAIHGSVKRKKNKTKDGKGATFPILSRQFYAGHTLKRQRPEAS
jgi:hypothetical protein